MGNAEGNPNAREAHTQEQGNEGWKEKFGKAAFALSVGALSTFAFRDTGFKESKQIKEEGYGGSLLKDAARVHRVIEALDKAMKGEADIDFEDILKALD